MSSFFFWNAHGIMHTSGLLQSKWSPKGFTLSLQETRSIHDSMNMPKIECIADTYIYYNHLKYKNIFNLGIKIV